MSLRRRTGSKGKTGRGRGFRRGIAREHKWAPWRFHALGIGFLPVFIAALAHILVFGSEHWLMSVAIWFVSSIFSGILSYVAFTVYEDTINSYRKKGKGRKLELTLWLIGYLVAAILVYLSPLDWFYHTTVLGQLAFVFTFAVTGISLAAICLVLGVAIFGHSR